MCEALFVSWQETNGHNKNKIVAAVYSTFIHSFINMDNLALSKGVGHNRLQKCQCFTHRTQSLPLNGTSQKHEKKMQRQRLLSNSRVCNPFVSSFCPLYSLLDILWGPFSEKIS